MMVDAFQLPICVLLHIDVKIQTHSCVPTGYVQQATLLVSMRGRDAQLICSSVMTVGAPLALAPVRLHLFMLAMDVLSQLARILIDAQTVNVLRVLALAQFLKVAAVIPHHQTALFALSHVLLTKCDVLTVLAILRLHARQRKDAI